MKHLFFFPFPWLSLLRLGAPKLQNPRRNCLGNKEPFLHRFCASPKCGNALKTRTTPKPNKRRCQKSGVRFKQTYKRHIPKMSKGTKERHQRPGGSLVWPSFLSETLLRTSFKSEGSVQFTQQSQSPHQALNQQTVDFRQHTNLEVVAENDMKAFLRYEFLH